MKEDHVVPQADSVIPQIDDAINPMFYRSKTIVDGYELKSPQPQYFGWFDLDIGHGCHFSSKVFLGQKYVLGRYITEAHVEEFLRLNREQYDVTLTKTEFDQLMVNWLDSADQTKVMEWWLQD